MTRVYRNIDADQLRTAFRADVARHEAGHAVAAAALGRMPREAVIGEQGGGRVRYIGKSNPVVRIVCSMAGSLAKAGDLAHMSNADKANVNAAVAEFEGDKMALVADGERHARFIVYRYADAIERVAEALHTRGRLFGWEVLQLVGPIARHEKPEAPKRLPVIRV